MKPTTLVLRAAGANCDGETAHAFQLAGAKSQILHINRLLERPALLDDYQILAFPGGFSYGDDIAAGKILANQIAHHLSEAIRRFVEAGKPVIGICNGFQVLIKTDLLLDSAAGQGATLTNNDSGRFIDRWIRVMPRSTKCIWTAGLGPIDLPIAHGEGKFVPASESVRKSLRDNDQIALTYAKSEDPSSAAGPHNPNGSIDDIAGICDTTGLVFGLMPHPERHVDALQHPAWTSRKPLAPEGQGLQVFRNAVIHATHGVGAGV